MQYPNGSESVLSPGPWSQLVAVRKAMCCDGRARYARITGQADTFFSIPASVKVKGKRVTGFITSASDYIDGVESGYVFKANRYGKNAALLEENIPA